MTPSETPSEQATSPVRTYMVNERAPIYKAFYSDIIPAIDGAKKLVILTLMYITPSPINPSDP
jgi:hypothetical protein